jgi:peptidoglycan/xylan/chitin deacetylase (PgdA/CDA1 family)
VGFASAAQSIVRAVADVLVLCYHAVSERFPAPLSVTPEALERQVALLARAGYRGVTFAEAVAEPEGKMAALTFDDAYLSVLELGKPILDAAGFRATVYAPTGYLDTPERPLSWDGIENWIGGEHESELLPMSWDQLGGLADEGWEIGSHTVTHPHLTRLDDDALRRELSESRATVEERLGRPCPTIAYPYGDHDERVVAAAGAAGYAAAGTLPARLPRARPLAWPRIGIYHSDDERRFKLKVSRAMRRLRGSRLWPG